MRIDAETRAGQGRSAGYPPTTCRFRGHCRAGWSPCRHGRMHARSSPHFVLSTPRHPTRRLLVVRDRGAPCSPAGRIGAGRMTPHGDTAIRAVLARCGYRNRGRLSPTSRRSMNASIVVENRTGAGGAIGAAEAARRAGRLHAAVRRLAFHHGRRLDERAGYDPLKQFVRPRRSRSDRGLLVHPDLPASTMRRVHRLREKHPGRVNYGSAGPGSVNPGAELFWHRLARRSCKYPTGNRRCHKDLIGGSSRR